MLADCAAVSLGSQGGGGAGGHIVLVVHNCTCESVYGQRATTYEALTGMVNGSKNWCDNGCA